MPTKKTFDLVVITSLLLHLAVGLVRLEGRRLSREGSGPVSVLGDALVVAL